MATSKQPMKSNIKRKLQLILDGDSFEEIKPVIYNNFKSLKEMYTRNIMYIQTYQDEVYSREPGKG